MEIENSSIIKEAFFVARYTGNPKLIVTFKNGSVYCYSGLFESEIEEFFEAESKGQFLNRVVKMRADSQKL